MPFLAQNGGDLAGVGVPAFGGAAVVAADRLPGVAVVADALVQHPGAGHDVGAGIVQVLPSRTELIGPAGVDLHQADIDGAVAVMVAGGGVEAALAFGDGPEEDGRDCVALPGLLETEGLGGGGG